MARFMTNNLHLHSQNGRRGWQSPNQEIPNASRLDYPLLKPCGNNIKTGSFKEGTLSASTTHYSSSSSNRPTNYLTTAPTTFYQMKEIDQSMMQANPQIIVTSKSTTNINNNSIHYNTLHPPPLCYSTATSSSNELLDDKPKYLISSSSSSVNSAIMKSQNESNNNVFVSSTNGGKQQQPSESKYGKIQPINKYMSKYRFFSKNTSTIDRYNGNGNSSDDFCASNTALHDAPSMAKGKNINCDVANGACSNSIKCNNEINNRTARSTVGGQCSTLQPLSNAATTKIYRNGNGFGGATAAYSTANNTLTPPPAQHQTLQHGPNKLGYSVINHVSSPESAYSTGYSTDGNSPGKQRWKSHFSWLYGANFTSNSVTFQLKNFSFRNLLCFWFFFSFLCSSKKSFRLPTISPLSKLVKGTEARQSKVYCRVIASRLSCFRILSFF